MSSRRRPLLALVAGLAALTAFACLSAGTASAAAPRDGWGFGISDRSTTEVMGLHFRHLEPKTFRTQLPWNAYYTGDVSWARGMIDRARSLGVQQVVVSLDDAAGMAPPDPATWRDNVRLLVAALDDYVDVWGPANEPNWGRGWLKIGDADVPAGAGPELLADYYKELRTILTNRGGHDLLLSPEFHDDVDENGQPVIANLPSGPPISRVRRYIERYVAAGGGWGDYAGWHPYEGTQRLNIASTDDFAAAVPSNIPIWVSEIGAYVSVRTVRQDLFAQNIRASWITERLARHARVARLNYHHMRAEPYDAALTNADGSIRPSWLTWCLAAHGDSFNARACKLDARVVSLHRSGVTYLATRGPDGAVWMRTYTALTGWTVWYSLGGDIAGDPALLSWGPGHVVVFARRASDGALVQRFFNGGQWNAGWERIGDWQIAGNPAPISWGDGHIDVFARGTDGALIHTYFGNSSWHPFASLGGQIKGDPSVISWGTGALDVYVRGTDDAIHHKWFANSAWSSFENLGGAALGDPAAISGGYGHNEVFIRGTDNHLYHRWFGNSSWSPGWERIGDWQIASDPSPISVGWGKTDVHARGWDDKLIHTWLAPTGWQPFERIGDWKISGRPSGIAAGGDNEEVFARGVDSRAINVWFPTPTGWSGWNSLGSPGVD